MTDVGVPAEQRRLPFVFRAHGGAGRLVLPHLPIGRYLDIERLELELSEVSVEEPEDTPAERFQRRRTQLSKLTVRIGPEALRLRVEATRRQLAALGISQVNARFGDGFVSVRARIADGLAVADLSFRVFIATAGAQLRILAGGIRVHGHLPMPGPLLADRVLSALLAVGEGERERRPVPRGLCDLEIDLVGGLLWQLLPPRGWRLPKTAGIELAALRISRTGIEVSYAPLGARSDAEIGVGALAIQLATAHDLMHTADEQLREGQLEEAMRGYRSLLASGGPDQPIVLGRILSLAITRSSWFYDGVELARQALARWPHYAPAHAALAGILLAQGDAREAASHLHALARLASGEGDDDEAALAALAGARLLRVLDPRASTQLYQLALEHDPASLESAEALADRLTDEARWPELVRLLRARAVTAAPERAVQLRLRLAEVLARELADEAAAQTEVSAAEALAPADPAVHEMAASLREAAGDVASAVAAWRTVIELAQRRGEASDRRTEARAWARLGTLLMAPPQAPASDDADGGGPGEAAAPSEAATAGEAAAPQQRLAATSAWRRALELSPAEPEALGGLGRVHRERGEHAAAIALYERVRGAGLPLHVSAHFELEMAKCLIEVERLDDARAALRRAAVGRTETAAEAHALLAEISAFSDPHHAAAELDTAIASLVDLAEGAFAIEGHRLFRRAAQLAVARADLLDRQGDEAAAAGDLQRAHFLAANHDAQVARQAARALLERCRDDAAAERRWLDAVLATEPPAADKAQLLMRSAAARRSQSPPDAGTALAEVREASRLSVDAELRRRAFELEAELLSDLGNQRARATALSSLAELTATSGERMAAEVAAAAAWLAADDAAAALPHAAAAAAIGDQPEIHVAPALRRHVLSTFGEAAWRQRAWADVVRAYSELVGDTPPGSTERIGFLLRIAVAADKRGDIAVAKQSVLAILDGDRPPSPSAVLAELRGSALRLLADMADRSGDGASAAAALEKLAAANAGEATPIARAEALYRAGELYRRASLLEDAVRCLEAALRIADAHLPALDALELAWRERGDLERVAVVLGRKVAATRQPARQKPLLVRLGDLQAQLGRPDVARATHRRALDIDPSWRPSLRFFAQADSRAGQLAAAARTYAQLAGVLDSDGALASEEIERDRRAAALALVDLLPALEQPEDVAAARAAVTPHRELPEVAAVLRQLDGIGELDDDDDEAGDSGDDDETDDDEDSDDDEAEDDEDSDDDDGAAARPRTRAATASEASEAGDADTAGGADAGRDGDDEAARGDEPTGPRGRRGHRPRARTGGGRAPRSARIARAGRTTSVMAASREEPTLTHRGNDHRATAEQFRASARLARQRGDLIAALAAFETAQHLSPNDSSLLAELVEVARECGDLPATARHLQALARLLPTGPRRADALIELADLYYDHLEDARAARAAMLQAAEALGATARGEATLRMVANEAASNLAWHTAVTALERIAVERRNVADVTQLMTALWRCGRDAAAVALVTAAQARLGALGAELLVQLRAGQATKQALAAELEAKAEKLPAQEARPLWREIETLHRDGLGDEEAAARAAARRKELGEEPGEEPGEGAAASASGAVAGAEGAEGAGEAAASAEAAASPAASTATSPAASQAAGASANQRASAPGSARLDPTEDDDGGNEFDDESHDYAVATVNVRRDAGPIADLDAFDDEDFAATHQDEEGELPGGVEGERTTELHRAIPSPILPEEEVTGRLTAPDLAAADLSTAFDEEEVTGRLATTDLLTTDLNASAFDDDDEVTDRLASSEMLTATRLAAAAAFDEAPVTRPFEVFSASVRNKLTIVPVKAAAPDEPPPAAAGPAGAEPGTAEAAAAASAAAAERGVDLLAATVELAGRGRARTITSALAAAARDQEPPDEPGPPARGKAAPRRGGRTSAVETRREATSLFRLANAELARGKLETAATLLSRAHALDPGYAPVLIPLADRLAATGDLVAAHRLFLQAAANAELSETRRHWAHARAESIGAHLPAEVRADNAARAVQRAAAESEAAAIPASARPPLPVVPPPPPAVARPRPGAEEDFSDLNDAVDDAAPAPSAAAPPSTPSSRAATAPLDSSRAPTLPGASEGEAELGPALEPGAATPIPSSDRPTRRLVAPSLDELEDLDDLESLAGRAGDGGAATAPLSPLPRTGDGGPAGGEGRGGPIGALDAVHDLIAAGNLTAAIALAEKIAAEAPPHDLGALELLEELYLEIGDGNAASEAIGRQLEATSDPAARAQLWHRRARTFREIGREQQAYRCLKEAHACDPEHPDHAYELRCAAMARREWGLVVSLLQREIEAATDDLDRAALTFELGLIHDERLNDADKAVHHYERALDIDPTIPAVDVPLARRYEEQGRHREAAIHLQRAASRGLIPPLSIAAPGATIEPTAPLASGSAVSIPLAEPAPASSGAAPPPASSLPTSLAGSSGAAERYTPSDPSIETLAVSLAASFAAAAASFHPGTYPGTDPGAPPSSGAPDSPPAAAASPSPSSPVAPPATPPDGSLSAEATAAAIAAAPRRSGVIPFRAERPERAERPDRSDLSELPKLAASLAAVELHIDNLHGDDPHGGDLDPPPSAPPDIPALEDAIEHAKASGDRAEILAAGRRLWSASPGNPVAFSALANEHTANGDLESLIELTAVRAAMTAENAGRASLWIDVARLAEELGEEPQAARAYDLALIEDPSSPIALDARAGLAFRLGDFATAEMIYRDIEPADSILPVDELMLRRSVIAEQLDRSADALTYAQAAAAAAPGRVELQRRVQELATRAGDLATALPAARAVMALVPIDQEEEVLASHFALVGLLHAIGDHAGAIANLERLRREHPGNRDVIAALASVHADRGDWTAACQYLYMLVPLAASVRERALRLFELGEVFLTKVGDLERADDAFLRASDLDPGCVPALRRLIDSYWRADQLGPILDLSTDLAQRGALLEPEMDASTLGRATLAAAIAEDYPLAAQILNALGADAAGSVASALIELVGRDQKLTVPAACRALRVLHDRGVLDLHAIIAMAEHPEIRRALQHATPS